MWVFSHDLWSLFDNLSGTRDSLEFPPPYQPGWKGKRCGEDVNECVENSAYDRKRCNPIFTSRCLNLPGTFQCFCVNGIRGITCDEDVNECSTGSAACNRQNTARCQNMKPGYRCVCKSGLSRKTNERWNENELRIPLYFQVHTTSTVSQKSINYVVTTNIFPQDGRESIATRGKYPAWIVSKRIPLLAPMNRFSADADLDG